MQSRTIHFPSIIDLNKNLGSNFINSLLFSSPLELEIFWVPIRSVHSKFFVQKQIKVSSILLDDNSLL